MNKKLDRSLLVFVSKFASKIILIHIKLIFLFNKLIYLYIIPTKNLQELLFAHFNLFLFSEILNNLHYIFKYVVYSHSEQHFYLECVLPGTLSQLYFRL
jgi:hypothetical protein